jgi:peptidoglycan L-alanyl-D-glutamate endopeptidase CwlK
MPDTSLLIPEFWQKVQQVITLCGENDLHFKVVQAVRTPMEQAKLWRQSRTPGVIAEAVAKLRAKNGDFLAKCIEEVGPVNGPRVTGSLPGYSWHQWCEAVDLAWEIDGRIEWNNLTGYKKMAEIAKSLGLTAGYFWTTPDAGHLQFRPQEIPGIYSVKEVSEAMEKKFG